MNKKSYDRRPCTISVLFFALIHIWYQLPQVVHDTRQANYIKISVESDHKHRYEVNRKLMQV
jgi:hypothetical protein